MPQALPLPDGRYVTIREGETPADTWLRAQQMYPEAFGPKAAPKPTGAAPSSLKDLATSFGLGATGSFKALTDVAGADNAASRTLGGISEDLSRAYTPARQAEIERRQQLIKEAEKSGSTLEEIKANLGAVTEAPLQSALQGLGSIVPYAVTGGVGAAAKFLPTTVRTINTLMGAAQGAGAVKGSIYDTVYGKLKEEGVSEDLAKQQAVEAQNYVGKNFGQIALGTGIGAAAGRFGVESLLAPGAAKAAAPGLGRRVGTTLLSEMPLEGIQGGQERLASNIALQNIGRDVPTFQGVAGQAAQEAAMAGLAAGPVAAVRSPAAETQRVKDEESRKLREEARLAEAERVKSPDYLLTFAQDYEDRLAKIKELQALPKKIKDATPEQEYELKQRREELTDLRKGLFADTPEYKRVKPLVQQVQEQQRVEKLSPEEYMLEQTMQGGRGAAPAPTGGRMKGALGINEVPEPPAPDTRVADYATGQIDAARSMGQLDVKDYVDYLMQDPTMAVQTLQQRPALPGLDNEAQKAVFDGLRLNLRDREKAAQAESKAELAQRTEDYKAQQVQPKPDPLERYLASEQQVEEHRSTAETNFDYLNDMFTSAMGGAEPTIEINNEIKATADSVRKAPQVRDRVENLLKEADQADTDYANALKSKEPAAAKAAFERGNAALERINSMSQDGGPYAKEILRLRQQQNNALNKLEDVADKLRRKEVLGKNEMAASTTQSLTNEAGRMRTQFIKASLQEAATHRRAEGKPPLTKDEANKATSDMYDTLNEWIDRVQKEPQRNTMESVLVEPAQLRAHKLIRQARYEQRRVFDERPLEEYRFGAYPQAVAVLKEQLDKTRRDLFEIPSKATRQESFLKTQFSETEAKKVAEAKGETVKTLGGELRRRSEYTLTNLEKALARSDLPQGGIYEGVKNGQPYVYRVEDMRELLEKARDAIEDGNVSRDLLDAVDAQVERIMRGEDTGTALVRAKETVSEKRVVRNVPGKEGYTEFGTRRKTQEATREEERAPLSEYQRDIEDALKAFAPTAMEQKEAGQKSLFPETEEDIGYIRMSPKNFANSPKIRPVWEALDAARAATKRKADKEQKVAARSKAMAETVRRIEINIELLKKDTKFFWTDTTKWTNKQVAQAAVTYPEIGNTPEENALVDRYLKKAALTPEETDTVVKLIRDFNTTKKSEYDKNLKQAEQLVAQGERLDDLDNQLLRTMQDTNKSVRDSAEKLRKELAPLKIAIDHITDSARKNKKETPLMRQIKAIEAKADKARNAYRQRVEEMYDTAYKNMDSALAEILDPEIAKAQTGLKKAAETLKKEKAELERVQQKVKDVLAQPSGKDRMLLATYEQFRYEEKKSIIEDLENKIQEQEKDLSDMMETREEAHDTAAAVLQAVSDKKTQNIFEKVVALETQLATLRGEEVTTTTPAAGKGRLPNYKYPFAQQKLDNDLKAARAQLEAVQKEQKATNDKIKSSKEQVKKQTAEFGVSVTRRQLNKKEREELEKAETALVVAERKQTELRKQLDEKLTRKERKALEADLDQTELAINQLLNTRLRLQTQIKPLEFGRLEKNTDVEALLEQKELDKLSKQSRQQADQADDARRRAEIKELQLQQIDEEIGDLVAELGAYDQLPNDINTLRQLSEDENTRPKQRNEAIAKLGVLQNIESLEAQRDTVEEGKPRRKQAAATTETSLAQSAKKPFRSASDKTSGETRSMTEKEFTRVLKNASEGLASERAYNDEYEPPDLSGLFRTVTKKGKGLKVDAVTKLANQITNDWERTPEIVVVADETGLPDAIQEQARKQKKTGQIPGVFDPNSNIVYLVASNLKDANDVALTIAHEVLGHFGLRAMLGNKYTGMMNNIFDGNETVRKQAVEKMEKEGLSKSIAVEEVLAEMSEKGDMANDKIRGAIRNILYAIKQWFAQKLGIKDVSDNEVKQLLSNARRFVKKGKGPIGLIHKGEFVFRTDPVYANDEMRAVGALADKFVAKQKNIKERVQAASGGFLGLETQLVDRFAGFERLSKVMDALKGSQMMYYLRMFDQRMNFVSQAVANGALKRVEKIRADGSKEYIIESNEGASIRGVVETLRDAKQYVGNGEAVNRLFTLYMSGIRAKNKGFAALNFGEDVSEADLKEAMRAVEGNKPLKDIFNDARKQYNEYNRDMLQFVADSGAISDATRKALIQENDYIPWYRERNGVAELVIGREAPIRIGSIAEQPYLHELVGGDRPILDFMTSAVQNTNMLADMGLRNTATKNAVFELVDMQLAKIVGASSGPNIVKFKKDGKDMYASIETDSAGIPADILVKGMEGIPTQMPAIWRLMAMPARLLRKAVTLSPLYAARQLFRDSVAAPILSGANFVPVFGALKEINSATKKTLERRGVTGGQIFTGTSEDLSKILRDITDGKPGWMNLLAKAEALNMEADATTRRAQYNSYIEQGLSEMEATLMALESMNFNKRGASPSVHIAGALIPFFNAQIQALNVLYKAFTGKMPFNERLKIQQKLLQRGGLLAGATLAYAAMMQDDEAYKNATPEQKYGNWFVRIPGVDEPIRIPVPFEIGYIFKAIPEALYNSMVNEHGDEEAVKAFKQILLQTIPGGSSYGIPQAAKPLIEYGLGKSFYTGREILSAHEKGLLPEEQFRVNTSEAAKLIGKATGTSPILLEELVKGYTGTMGLAFLQAVSIGIPKGDTPEKAAARLSELPVIGGAFQPNDAAGIINATYDRFEDAIKLQRTVDNMFNEGRAAEGMALLEANMNEYMAGEMGDYFTTQMKELTQFEKAIQAMDISPAEKRERLSEVRQLKITVAASSRREVDEIAPR